MAGMVPGVLIGVIYMVYNYIHCKVTGIGEKSPFQPNAWSRLSSPPFPP